MIFYIATFFLGLLLDFKSGKTRNNETWRKLFVFWFFIFSCFGYMTGSDWRGYELDFYYQNTDNFLYASEGGFGLIFKIMYHLTHDYWITVGVLKCLFLYTLIRWLRMITPFWLSILAITILNTDTFGLGFILIDNPLRYMVASIFINLAVEQLLLKKRVYAILLMLLAVTCHNSTLFYLLTLIPIFVLCDRLFNVNRILIVAIYVVIIIFVSVADNLVFLKDSILQAIRMRVSGFESYSSYVTEDTATLFSIGSLIKYFLFVCVLLTRDYIAKVYDKGRFLYGITIVFFFFDRILVAIPTGSRLLLVFNFFTVLYFVLLLRNKRIWGYAYIFLMLVTAGRNIWNSYQYIPYSNSIPYIITGHKPYSERSINNPKAFTERTGKHIDSE